MAIRCFQRHVDANWYPQNSDCDWDLHCRQVGHRKLENCGILQGTITYPTLGKVIEIIIKSTFGMGYICSRGQVSSTPNSLEVPSSSNLFVRGKTDGFCIERDVFRFCLKSASFLGKRMATWLLKKAVKTALADENRGVMHKGATVNGSLKSYSKSDLKFLKCLPTPPPTKTNSSKLLSSNRMVSTSSP